MKDGAWEFLCVVLCVVCLLLGLAAGVCIGTDSSSDSYRKGQIDALSGKVKYELREQPNGERVWVDKATTQRSNP
jgi:hypothetical protein